jgi:hypothetical protein
MLKFRTMHPPTAGGKPSMGGDRGGAPERARPRRRRGRGSPQPVRLIPAPDVDRRTPAAPQRAAGRDVDRGAATGARRYRRHPQGDGLPLRRPRSGQVRHYRLGAGAWPPRPDVSHRPSRVGQLLQTTFSEAHERFSPGLVLRGMVLQATIERRGSPPTVSSARLTDTSRAGLGASSSGADLGLAPTSREGYGTLPTPGGL